MLCGFSAYLVGQKLVLQNFLKLDLVTKLLSDEHLCPTKILSYNSHTIAHSQYIVNWFSLGFGRHLQPNLTLIKAFYHFKIIDFSMILIIKVYTMISQESMLVTFVNSCRMRNFILISLDLHQIMTSALCQVFSFL